jgi:DNA-directed RNA polymerase specialized sigma24 family protein
LYIFKKQEELVLESNNRYTDINPTVIWQIKFYAKYLKNTESFVDEQLEDIEQELLVQVWPLLNQYDWNKGKFSVFSNLVIKRRASNLMTSAKRNRMPSIEISDKEYFIDTTHIDVDFTIT